MATDSEPPWLRGVLVTLALVSVGTLSGVVAFYVMQEATGPVASAPAVEEALIFEAVREVPANTSLENRDQLDRYFKRVSKPKTQLNADTIPADDFDSRINGRMVRSPLKPGTWLADSHLVVVTETVEVFEALQLIPEFLLLARPEQLDRYFKKEIKPKSEIPRDAILAGDLAVWERVNGRMIKRTMNEGDILTDSNLYLREVPADPLKPGETAYTIKGDPEALGAGTIFPKDRVDVWAAVPAKGGEPAYAELILEDIEVLATDVQRKENDGKPGAYVWHVVLRLTADQVGKVASYLDKSSTLRLAKARSKPKR